MDIVKEVKELVQAIKDALQDGRLTVIEIGRIVKELVDILVIVLPLFLAQAGCDKKSD